VETRTPNPTTTILDKRVPRPGREAEYEAPAVLLPGLRALYRKRNHCSDAEVDGVDEAILRLLSSGNRS